LTLVTIWWLLFWTAVGLCVGSFLNCVIYRIPRDRSLRVPLWSACPHCRKRIHWYDNIPILSFVLLRGRCRHCGVPIATRYIVVELTSAMIVLLLLDAFFIGHARSGLTASSLRLTEQLANDWPIFAAHIVLFSCLLAMSAIDLEHYWVDIRFTNLVTVAGFVLHTLWTPRHSHLWPRPLDTTAVVSIFALCGLGLVWVVLTCQPQEDEPEPQGPAPEQVGNGPAVGTIQSLPPSLSAPSRMAGWFAGVLFALLLLALCLDATEQVSLRYIGRPAPILILFFFLVLSENTVLRHTDQAIVEAIHDERHEARRMVLFEFSLLVPALVFGLIGYWLMQGGGELPGRVGQALDHEFSLPGLAFMRHWAPLNGFATAASGYILAGAIGWGVRILFTLAFGKEAFGVGDIHLMAATGCVAGWPVVAIGFLLCCPLALLGWAATLPFKRTRALPLGPWLALSFLIVVLFYDPILRLPMVARSVDVIEWIFLRESQAVNFGGLP